MKQLYITPKSFADYILQDDFKKWILKNYKTNWHVLSDTILNEALEKFNTEYPNIKLLKFWN